MGGGHVCALSTTSVLYCWGWDGFGQLGDGAHSLVEYTTRPAQAAGLPPLVSAGAGIGHTCVVFDPSGAVNCWGWNSDGQLGDGTTTTRSSPVTVLANVSAVSAGADAVMLGSILAACAEAPGKGNHWGMATPHAGLPRGVRVRVGVTTTLQQVLFGPSHRTDGTENFVGALRTSMGMVGARTIRDFQQAEMVVAPSIKTEGKQIQHAQG
jgi:hypothetical protein